MSSLIELPKDLILPDEVDLDLVIPRVCVWPTETYAYSRGQDAIDLALSAGLTLDVWQQLVLHLGLGQTAYGRWAAFQVALIVARQNGKGAILEALELYWLFLSNEPLVGHSAHEYKTAMEAFRRVLFLVTNTDWLRKKVKKVINTNGEEGIELLNGNRLRFMARSKGAGRGFSFHKIIWDEAYALTGEQQDAQLPTLSAMPDPQVWLTSSPPLDQASGGALFKLRRLAAEKAPDLTFLDYGAAGSLDDLDAIALDDRETWKRTNPAFGIRISMMAIEREYNTMGRVGFARERLGIWPPDLSEGYTVIGKDAWDALRDEWSGRALQDIIAAGAPATVAHQKQLIGRPALAVDLTPRSIGRVRASIGLAQRRFDGKRHLEVIRTGSGSSWVVADLVALVKKLNPCAVVIDPGSPAGSLLAEIEAAFTEAGVDLEIIVKMGARDVAQAFGMIYDAATGADDDRTIAHLGQPELDLAVGGADKRPVGDGHAWNRRNASADITPVVGVTHALYGLAVRGSDPDPVMPWVMYL